MNTLTSKNKYRCSKTIFKLLSKEKYLNISFVHSKETFFLKHPEFEELSMSSWYLIVITPTSQAKSDEFDPWGRHRHFLW